jgi:hypothetical protein
LLCSNKQPETDRNRPHVLHWRNYNNLYRSNEQPEELYSGQEAPTINKWRSISWQEIDLK